MVVVDVVMLLRLLWSRRGSDMFVMCARVLAAAVSRLRLLWPWCSDGANSCECCGW